MLETIRAEWLLRRARKQAKRDKIDLAIATLARALELLRRPGVDRAGMASAGSILAGGLLIAALCIREARREPGATALAEAIALWEASPSARALAPASWREQAGRYLVTLETL